MSMKALPPPHTRPPTHPHPRTRAKENGETLQKIDEIAQKCTTITNLLPPEQGYTTKCQPPCLRLALLFFASRFLPTL